MALQTQAFVSEDSYMTRNYLNFTQFAARVGVTTGALGSQKNLPEPDVTVGEGPRATRGWSEKTIDAWNKSRPGSGNWGPKIPAKRKK